MSDKPTHPGKYFRQHVMEPYDLTVPQLAENFNMAESVIENFLNGRSSMTASMAISLDVAFPDLGMTACDWMEMQYIHALAFVNERCSFDHIVPYRGVAVEPEEKEEELDLNDPLNFGHSFDNDFTSP